MVENQNVEITNRISEDTKITPQTSIPNNVSNSIQPVLISNPLKISTITASAGYNNNTAATIYTTPSKQDFYLTSATFSFMKDANNTSTSIYLVVTIGGAVKKIGIISTLTLTAHSDSKALTFPYPLKIDRGTDIQVGSSSAVANIRVDGAITGFIKDTLTK